MDPYRERPKRFKDFQKSYDFIRRDRVRKMVVLKKDKFDQMLEEMHNEEMAVAEKLDQAIITSTDDVLKLVQECDSSNIDVAYHAIFNFLLYLCRKQELFLDTFLETDVKYNIACALTNIASGDFRHTSYLLEESVIAALSSLLCDTNTCLVEQSIWALSNIIGDGPEPRNFVLRSNILSALYQPLNLHYKSIPVMKHLSLMLINICYNKDAEVPIEYVPQIISILDVLLAQNDENILDAVLWSMTYLSDCSSNYVSLLFESGIVDKIYKFLYTSEKMIVDIFKIVSQFSTNEHIQFLLNNGIYVHLRQFLNAQNSCLKKEIYWVLSNIAAGTRSQMLTVLSSDFFPEIIKNLEEGPYEVKREACWVIINVIHGCIDQEVEPFIDSKLLYSFRCFMVTRNIQMFIAVLVTMKVLLRVKLLLFIALFGRK
ncbi:Importin subunit alpha-5 [Thelohanellus kitauei]|uniref:Importin subunit alpha-5 n=1 Tax=Thelohanellus kitauei TaxID=669202 RepID=A0A0C2IZ87_THEKT|nr:Importin subunit alpha-5 [Thelohanellus kitauei]